MYGGNVNSVINPILSPPNVNHATDISLYFTLDNGLEPGNYLNVILPSDLSFTITSVTWAQITLPTLVPTTYLYAALTSQFSNNNYISFYNGEDATDTTQPTLLAGTVYGLFLETTTAVTASASVYGPIRLYTSTNIDTANQQTEIIIDDNPLFGSIKLYAAPTNITATIARSTTDDNAKYSSQSSTHTLSLTGLNTISQ